MNIHEYQAKAVLKGFGVSVPQGGIAFSPDEAVQHAESLGGPVWVVKAQIHACLLYTSPEPTRPY